MSLKGEWKQEIWQELEARLPGLIAQGVREELDRREKSQKRAVKTAGDGKPGPRLTGSATTIRETAERRSDGPSDF